MSVIIPLLYTILSLWKVIFKRLYDNKVQLQKIAKFHSGQIAIESIPGEKILIT